MKRSILSLLEIKINNYKNFKEQGMPLCENGEKEDIYTLAKMLSDGRGLEDDIQPEIELHGGIHAIPKE